MLAILAGMPDTCLAETTSLQAGALVLVNSQSAKYLDFQHYLQPYLDNFGVPYTVRDIRTNTVGPEVSRYALLIVGHSQLDINQLYLDSAAQANLSAAVANGTGLVNFDNDLVTVGGQARYPFVQSVFGFAYGAAAAGVTVTFPPTEPGGQMHAITARHQANEVLSLLSSMSFVNLSLPAGARAVAQSGGKPFVVVKEVGQGRAVQWASYDWMSTRVQGPLNGLDDVLWRSLVWAARKPFAMRGFPNLVTMRVDDLTGPYTWVHIANEVGFKPYLAIFISEISQADAADVSRLATSGNATAGVHSFTAGDLFYFDSRGRNWSDSRMADYYARGTRWHLDNGIPFPKSIIFHGSEVGSNAFGGLKDWGVEFVLLEAPIGTRMYEDPTPWLIAGPYRLYETPQEAKSYLPMFYADFLPIPGHPEFDGWFFDCYTEIRNVAPIRGDWSPNNDVAASTDRGIRHLKRGLDSLVLATLWTHEKYLAPISAANWRAIMQGVTNGLAAYKPVYVTLDYANQYVRATRTSRLVESTYDPASGQLVVTLTGKTDLDTLVHVFVDQSQALNPSLVTVPQFSGATTITAATLPAAPVILSPPESRTNLAGSSASFAVSAAGTAPLSYRWLKNQTNRLSDGGKIQGAISATLTLSNVLGGDAGTYSVVVSNSVGSLTSAPAAALTVIDPVITAQPLSRTNHAGSAATFRVETCGTPPVYQWQKDGAPLSGATWSTLTLPAVTAANAGAYSVLVSNTYGSRNSLTAELKVVSPPVVESTALSDSIFTMSWSAIAGQSYRLQYKDNLEQTNWYEWLPDRTASGPVVTVTNSVDNWTQRFYRVLLVP